MRSQSVGDEDLWTASKPLTVAGVDTRALCPADQLLHICVHGVSATPAPMRWLADAVIVIRTSGDQLAWERVIDRAIARGCTVALLDALIHLEGHVSIPAWVIDRLRAAPASRAERLAHATAVSGYKHVQFMLGEWDRYSRLRAARVPGVQPNYAAYLIDCLSLDGYSELAVMLGRKALQIVRRRGLRSEDRDPIATVARSVD
jgi:Uncharacterised nucleotidyltransferase